MKKLLLVLLAFSPAPASAAQVDPSLLTFARGETAAKSARVIALLDTSRTQAKPPARYRTREVLQYFRKATSEAWQPIAKSLKDLPRDARVRGVHWINASASLDVTPAGLRALAKMQGVRKIYAAREVGTEQAKRVAKPRRHRSGELPYDLKELGIDRLRRERPEVTGKGVLLGHLDSGVDGEHPLLKGKIARFYNTATGQVTEPIDEDEHGTHTAGTMVANQIGMAPEAKLVSSSVFSGETVDNLLRGMEFMLNTGIELPRAINNSWNCEGAPDIELFYKAIEAWEAAGILPVFSAGNKGRSGPRTITKPHEHPLAFAVGATGADSLRADFSSIGPGVHNGQDTKKPDLTAPGVEIVSTLPGGRDGAMSGTSMASPHITGAVALVLQVNPQLNPQQIRALFLRTLTPVDKDGMPTPAGSWNPYYGYGRANAHAAVLAASAHAERLASLRTEGERVFTRLFTGGSAGGRQADLLSQELDSVEIRDLSAWTDSARAWETPPVGTWADESAL